MSPAGRRKTAPPSWRDGVVASGGEMGRLVGAFDWSGSALGDIDSWPQSLRTSVSVCLASRFPIVLWWGPQLVMIYNDGYRPMLGASKHPLALGSPGEDIWPEIWHVIGPMLSGVMEGKGATWSDDQLLLLDRNGFLEECYFTYSYSPIVEESGAIGGVFCAVTETTEKVVGARRLETLGTLAAHLVDSDTVQQVCQRTVKVLCENPDDVRFAEIYLLEPGGGFARAAGEGLRRRRGSWPLAQVAGSGLGVVVPLDPNPLAAAAPGAPAAYVVPVSEPGDSEPRAVLVVGLSERRPFDAGYRSFLDLVGGHVGTAISGANAFERQRERAHALAELDAAKTTFFSNMSHELRTPLTLIVGPVADALEDTRQPLPPAQRDRLVLVARNASRLRRLVNGMLDFARIEGGRLVPERVEVDLAEATAELAANFSDVMRRAGLDFTVRVQPLPRPVMTDRDMWDRIVLNLLSNALKYTMQGKVEMVLADSDGQVELTVADTGLGIDERELPRLFDRFHRVAGAQGRSHEGSGIGLAMVAELLRLLGGTIAVTSEPGRGSVFRVRIPYGKRVSGRAGRTAVSHDIAAPFVEEALGWTQEQQSPAVHAVSGRPRLLIADDNPDLRNYLAGLLAGHYDLDLAADGEQALRMLGEHRPDLVLADVMMPKVDGLGLLRAVRDDPRLRDLPVLLLSARAGEEAAAEGFAAGADDYLVKPFSAQDLLTRLRAAFTRATARSRDTAWRAALIRSMPDGVVIADHTGTVIEVNDAFAAMTGWDRADLPCAAPYPWWPTWHQDGLADLLRERSGAYEAPFVHRDGHRLWVSITASVVPGEKGAPDAIIATVRDITRDRELRQRREAAARLMAVLGSDLTETELQAAAMVGFGEVFGGEVALNPGDAADAAGPVNALLPGLLVEVPDKALKRIWVRFPVVRQVNADEQILAATLADALAAGLARAGRETSRNRAEQNLRQAVESHRFIGQAVGILMERHRLTASVAFERLRQASRDRNLKLREVAEGVINTGEDPLS